MADVAAAPESVAATLSSRRRNLAFATVAMGMLLAALDSTIVSTALPTIVGDLGGAQHMTWVVTAYMLTQTIATVLAGKFGDVFGRKLVFQVSCAIFVVASFLCGFAQGMTWLIAMRAVQGIGGGGLTVTATAVIADIIPLRDRGRYQGAIGAVFGVTTVIGPLLGGFFTDHLSWHWVFYVNVPLGIGVIALAASTLPAVRAVARPVIDYLGIALIAAGSGALILATSWGGTQYAWGSSTIIGLFVGAVVALALFCLVELRATDPVLPLRLFKRRVFTLCAVLAFVVGFALLGAMTFLPTYLQYVHGVSATSSGVRTLPMVAGLLVASITAGNVVSRTGRYKPFPIVGSVVMALGLWLMSRMDAHTGLAGMSLAMLVLGAGIGLSMQVLTIVVQNTSEYADLGVATSGVTFFRTMGSSFGASVFGTIYANQLAPKLAAAVASSGASPASVTSPERVDALPAAQHAPVIAAYVDALQVVFRYAVPVAALAFLLALALPQVRMRGLSQAAANDMGSGFGVPDRRTSAEHLESAVARVLRTRLFGAGEEILVAAGSALDPSQLWCLRQVLMRTHAAGQVHLQDIAAAIRVPMQVLAPAFADAIASGYLTEDADGLHVTAVAEAEYAKVREAFIDWLVERTEELEQVDAAEPQEVVQALRAIAARAAEEDTRTPQLFEAHS